MVARFEELKRVLFMSGLEAIEGFLGYEIDDEDKDVIERRMDMVYEQMPEVELEKFYAKHGIGPNEKLVNISGFEYEDGYLHFVVEADGHGLEGLYRLYDPANGPDMTLVSIDYGYLHPIIERQWSRIEDALYERCLNRYHGILDKSEAFKEKVIAAMAATGYTYDVLESHEGWESFYGEGGVRIGFDRLREAAEWLEGAVFDDPAVGRAVEEIIHPERVEKPLADVLEDATTRADNSSRMDAKETEKEELC